VRLGLVSSINRPGGNVTGVAQLVGASEREELKTLSGTDHVLRLMLRDGIPLTRERTQTALRESPRRSSPSIAHALLPFDPEWLQQTPW
jgi:hypothetical protein